MKYYTGWILSKIWRCGRNRIYQALRSHGVLCEDNSPAPAFKSLVKGRWRHTGKGSFFIPLFTRRFIDEYRFIADRIDFQDYLDDI